MTIFLSALRLLIKNRLSIQIAYLLKKSKDPRKEKVYLAQKQLLDTLDGYISGFYGVNKDDIDLASIIDELKRCRTSVQTVRADHGEPRDTGSCMACVSGLIFHVEEFHTKLTEYELINVSYNENSPLNLVFFHVAQYLGEDLFDPLTNSTTDIRKQKEKALKNRLQLLIRNLKDAKTLLDQIERTLEIIEILHTDNDKIKNPEVSGLEYLKQRAAHVIKTTFGLGSDRLNVQLVNAQNKLLLMKKRILEGLQHPEAKGTPFAALFQSGAASQQTNPTSANSQEQSQQTPASGAASQQPNSAASANSHEQSQQTPAAGAASQQLNFASANNHEPPQQTPSGNKPAIPEHKEVEAKSDNILAPIEAEAPVEIFIEDELDPLDNNLSPIL